MPDAPMVFLHVLSLPWPLSTHIKRSHSPPSSACPPGCACSVKKSGSTGENLKEAQAINKSLSALGDVISALATEQQHIPYRNHKLTMLMSDSLGGNAKTLMFVNVSPTDANLDETQNSLQYATRVRTIKNEARKDESNKDVVKLRKQVEYWKEQAAVPADKRT